MNQPLSWVAVPVGWGGRIVWKLVRNNVPGNVAAVGTNMELGGVKHPWVYVVFDDPDADWQPFPDNVSNLEEAQATVLALWRMR